MRKTAMILGIPVDSITMQEALEKVMSFLGKDKPHAVYTPNAEIIMAARRDPFLAGILRQADMLTADGAGVVLASRILGNPLPEKVSGIDLVKGMLPLCVKLNARFFFFGSKPGVAETAAENLRKVYSGLEVAGFRNGYFTAEEEEDIISSINSSGADILLVALGAPKQEKWIHEHKDRLKVKVCIGVGGSLDVFAGKAKLAPEFFRRNGLEWLYRLYREPWRFRRMLDLPRFILRVILERICLSR